MYAIIEQGGKQYKVTAGDRLLLDRKVEPDAKNVTLDQVLLVGGEGEAKIGQPLVAGASVTAEVLGEKKGPKIDSFKYNRRKGYHKRVGHRQQYTEVKISAINA